MKRILAVDDNRTTLAIVHNILKEQYDVTCVNSGEAALDFLQEQSVDLILLDFIMPEMNGMEVMKQLQQSLVMREIPVIFLTGESTASVETECLENGASDFISKPFAAATLHARVARSIELSEYRRSMEESVREKAQRLKAFQKNVVVNLAEVIESRDIDSGQHVKRSAAYVDIVARGLKEEGIYLEILTDEYIHILVDVAVLHDIGKIAVPDHILCKPGKLTPEEYEIVKKHAAAGGSLVKKCLSGVADEGYIKLAAEVTTYHHERWDGLGYPLGLKRGNIPLSARMVSVADAFDAMISKRVYKEAYDTEKTFQVIQEERGKQFDPFVTDIFLKNKDKIVEALNCYADVVEA